MQTVMAAGTFDVLHKGHEFFLKEAKKHGTRLVVIVARDESVERFKGRKPLYSEQARVDALRKLGIADESMRGHKGDIFEVIGEVKPDIICLGYDQRVGEEELAKELKRRNIPARVVRLPSHEPHIYKSSKLRPSSVP